MKVHVINQLICDCICVDIIYIVLGVTFLGKEWKEKGSGQITASQATKPALFKTNLTGKYQVINNLNYTVEKKVWKILLKTFVRIFCLLSFWRKIFRLLCN